MRGVGMNERLTWEEIKAKFPDQWVGLTSVEYKTDNSASIKSGILLYTDKGLNELTEIQSETNGETIAVYTTPDNALQMGLLHVFYV
jgi:hypothetical protein